MIKNKLIILYLFIILSEVMFPQTDWVRWEKSNPDYRIAKTDIDRNYDFEISSASDLLIKPVINSYWFFVSDLDGANCPFYPSCSEFFVESVEETNLVQGTIMFFDRFTRDTNFFDRQYHYPFYDLNHYYDPIHQYKLHKDAIKIYTEKTFVNK